jgi:hypothetical protein
MNAELFIIKSTLQSKIFGKKIKALVVYFSKMERYITK